MLFLFFLILAIQSTRAKLADGCSRVYVDYGSNIGMQVRKMYEPHRFLAYEEYQCPKPCNPSEPLFRSVFGENRNDVCTFGFEASPRHSARLIRLEKAYLRTGRRVLFFTETAVTTDGRNVSFSAGAGGEDAIDGGAAISAHISESPGTGIEVRSVDLAHWFLKEVVGRTLPHPYRQYREPRVLMKSDIEGTDMAVISRLFHTGALCHVHTLYYESAHTTPQWVAELRNNLTGVGCTTALVELDDETGQGGEAFIRQESKYFIPLP